MQDVTKVDGSFKLSYDPPFSTIGLFTFTRTYARRLVNDDPNSAVESWEQTLNRVIKASDSQFNIGFSDKEKRELYYLLYNLKCSVAGRFLWQMGSTTVDRLGLFSLQNCAFTVVDHPIRPFTWAMDSLMLGSGVGFSVERKHVNKLPPVLTIKGRIVRNDVNDADYIVPDSREGWVKLLGRVLKAYFYSGTGFSYSCMLLRSKGAPIKSFGGISSGPEVLCDGLDNIIKILDANIGKKLSSVDAMGIMCIIGEVVVSGNVRRSALLAMGDCDDIEYLKAKRWDLGNIPNYRAFSNNSVVCDDTTKLPDEFWEGYKGNGEPYGLINLELMRKCGRTGEVKYSDPTVVGVNPCAEVTLSNNETCCLSELFLPNIKSKDELLRCAYYMYKMCKHSLTLKCHSSETQRIVHKNMRIGVGVTGYVQATEEQRSWLPDCYTYLRELDNKYSYEMKLPRSIKLTTVKPSGTLSLLGGTTSGIHPAYSKYYIRRVRFSSSSPLVSLAKKNGYFTEYVKKFDGTLERDTIIIEFPCKVPDGTLLAEDCTAITQLNIVKRTQKDWADNAVSNTVYYKKEELPSIKKWLAKNYKDSVKSTSFLLHNDHGFEQAPLQQITKQEYETMSKKVVNLKRIPSSIYNKFSVDDNEIVNDTSCVGGMCPIR